MEDVNFLGRGGAERAARWWAPAARTDGDAHMEGAAVLLVPGGEAAEHGLDGQLAAKLAALGVGVLLPTAFDDVGDRAALAELDGALAWLAARPELDAERLGAFGLGRGGTLAFLLGCHSSVPAAVGLLDAPLVYAQLGPERPVQPLELALNLGCPLLAIFHEGAPGIDPAERAQLERVLSQFARDFDIVTADAGGADRVAAGAPNAAELAQRVHAFLSRVLAEV